MKQCNFANWGGAFLKPQPLVPPFLPQPLVPPFLLKPKRDPQNLRAQSPNPKPQFPSSLGVKDDSLKGEDAKDLSQTGPNRG